MSYNINDDSGWRKEILLENSHAFIGILLCDDDLRLLKRQG